MLQVLLLRLLGLGYLRLSREFDVHPLSEIVLDNLVIVLVLSEQFLVVDGLDKLCGQYGLHEVVFTVHKPQLVRDLRVSMDLANMAHSVYYGVKVSVFQMVEAG